MAANRIYIQVDFQSSSATAAIKTLNQNISNIGTTAARSSATAATGIRGFSVALEQSSRAASQLSSVLTGLAALRLGATMFEYADKVKRAEIAIATITKSADLAKNVLAEIRNIAKTQPFRFVELAEMGQRLAGFGFEARQIPKMVQTIADSTAALGGSKVQIDSITLALGQMRTKGLAQGQELFRQLAESGIQVTKYLAPTIAKEFNIPIEQAALKIRDLAEKSRLSGKEAVRLILEGMTQEFGGSGAKMSALVTVQFQKLLDDLGELAEKIGALILPEVTKLVDGVRGLVDWFSQLPDWVKKTAFEIIALTGAIKALLAILAFAGIKDNMKQIGDALQGVKKAFETVAIAAKLAFAAGSIRAFFSVLGPEMAALTASATGAGVAIAAIFTAIDFFQFSKLQQEMAKFKATFEEFRQLRKDQFKKTNEEIGKLVIENQELLKHQMDIAKEALLSAVGEFLGGMGQILSKSEGLLGEVSGNIDATTIAMRARMVRLLTFAREWSDRTLEILRDTAKAQREAGADAVSRQASMQLQQLDQVRDATLRITKQIEMERLEIQTNAIVKLAEARTQAIDADENKEKAILSERLRREGIYLMGNVKLMEDLISQIQTRREALELQFQQKRTQITKEAQDEISRVLIEQSQRVNDAILSDQRERMERALHEISREFDVINARLEARPAQTATEARQFEEERLRLAIEYSNRVTEVRRDALRDELKFSMEFWEALYRAGVISEVRFRRIQIALNDEYFRKRDELEMDHTANTEKMRLDSLRKTNEIFLNESRQTYEELRDFTSQIFDALMDRSTGVGKALLNTFKNLFIRSVRDIVTSRAAASLTELFGRGPVGFGGNAWEKLLGRQPTFQIPDLPPLTKAVDESVEATRELTVSMDRVATALEMSQRFGSAHRAIDEATDIPQMGDEEIFRRLAEGGLGVRDAVLMFVDAAAKRHGVDQALARTVAHLESSLIPTARSKAGAIGVMQLMPATAKELGVDPNRVLENIDGGVRYLGMLLDKYGGNISKVLAAYNAGMGAVAKYGGVPPFAETQEHVRKGLELYAAMGKKLTERVTSNISYGDIVVQPAEGPSLADLYNLPVGRSQLPLNLGQEPNYRATLDNLLQQYGLTGGGQGATINYGWPVGTSSTAPATSAGAGGITRLPQVQQAIRIRDSLGIGKPISLGQRLGSVLRSPGFGSLVSMFGLPTALAGLQRGGVLGDLMTIGGAAATGWALGNQIGLGPAGGAVLGAGVGLFASGLRRGGVTGLAMTTAGGFLSGAMIGLRVGGIGGAAVGAVVGTIVGGVAGTIRLFVKSADEKIREKVKDIYGIDIRDQNIRLQILEIARQNFGGNLDVALRSRQVQELVQLYGTITGQSPRGMPRPMYSASFAQTGAGLQLQPVYSGGSLIGNPYTGMTTAQVANQPIYVQIDPKYAQDLFEGRVINVMQANSRVVAESNANATRAGTSRVAQRQNLLEPLTVAS